MIKLFIFDFILIILALLGIYFVKKHVKKEKTQNIILIAKNPQLKATDLGVSPGQFNFIKSRYRSLKVDAVKQKIKFLSNFDLLLKTSQLDLDKRDMLSYLISNLNFKISN